MAKLTKKQKLLNKELRHEKTKGFLKKQEKKAHKKALKEWALKIKERDKNCQMCDNTGKIMHSHHLLPSKGYPQFRTELMNGVLLCPYCHKFGKHSAHQNSVYFVQWLIKERPKQYNWVTNKLVDELIDERGL